MASPTVGAIPPLLRYMSALSLVTDIEEKRAKASATVVQERTLQLKLF
jgi:hypothetical protein